MLSPLIPLCRGLVLSILLFTSAPAALANCSAFLKPTVAIRFIESFATVDDVQRGLRTALSDASPLLHDNTVGAYTQMALKNLCELVEGLEEIDLKSDFPEEVREVAAATQAAILEFSELNQMLAADSHELFSIDHTNGPNSARWLALAATPAITARAIDGRPNEFDCDEISNVLDPSPYAQSAMKTLKRLFDSQHEVYICDLFSAPADPAAIRDAFARLGRIDQSHGRGIETLLKADFHSWVNEQNKPRLRRLMATESAVADLLSEYGRRNAAADYTAHSGPVSEPSVSGSADRRFKPKSDEITTIKTRFYVEVTLHGGAKDNPNFESVGSLWSEQQAELGECVLLFVKPPEKEPEFFSVSYQLKPEAIPSFRVEPLLFDIVPILSALQSRTAPTEDKLLDVFKKALIGHNEAAMNTLVERAAAAMAAVAERTTPVEDSARLNPLPKDQNPSAQTHSLSIGDASMAAVALAIDNTEMIKALENFEFKSVNTTEQIKSQARAALVGEVSKQVEATTENQLRKIEPWIEVVRAIPDAQINEITALPYVHSVPKENDHFDASACVMGVVDLDISRQQQLEIALKEIFDDIEKELFSPFTIEQVKISDAKRDLNVVTDVTIDAGRVPVPPIAIPTDSDVLQSADESARRFVAFPNSSGVGMWLTDTQTGNVSFCFSQTKRDSTSEHSAACTQVRQKE